MDEGHLTDSLGHKVDFKNTVLIMTSNIGIRQLKNTSGYGFTNTETDDRNKNMKDRISEELKKTFNPEFLNRVDDTVVFQYLSDNEALKIVEITLREVTGKLKDRNIEFQLTEGAKKFITEKGFDPLFGARPLKRAIQKYIEDPIADELLKGTFGEGSVIQIKMKNKSELAFVEIDRKEIKPKDIEVKE
jgi:ATP-dependent Clp protease ATP-binding subunit ClpC